MAVERDPRSMSSQTLARAANDPDHPMHNHAKIELQRRRGEMQEIDLKTLTKKISNTGMKSTTKAMGADKLKKDLEAMKQKLQKEEKTFRSLRTEKTLTPAEKKKREEIAKAMEKDNPDMPMDKKMAIATAQAKKVAEAPNEGAMKRMVTTQSNKADRMASTDKKGLETYKKKVNELDNKTLKSYIKKASKDAADRGMDAVDRAKRGDTLGFGKQFVKSRDRVKNVAKAVDKLEATIPDGQTIMTKKPEPTKNDADKIAKIRAMLDKEKKK
jgi:hypothetical protein